MRASTARRSLLSKGLKKKKTQKAKKAAAKLKRSQESPFRVDSGVDHFHLNMRFYFSDIPQTETLDDASEALMADIRTAAKKHGFIYSGTTQVVKNHAQ